MSFLLLLGTINSNLIFLQIKNININKKWHQSISHPAALRLRVRLISAAINTFQVSTVVIESLGSPPSLKQTNWQRTLSLQFQSIEVAYGNIETSPLYVI